VNTVVVVSQIWIQHLHCTQIIGHCHLRAGSEIDPFLGGSLFTAMVNALADVEQEFKYTMSGFYGYRIPEIEGIGLFTVSDDHFRIFFLCEGLYKKGIPYFAGKKISKKFEKLFRELRHKLPVDNCSLAHRLENGYYWFDLMCSIGFGGEIQVEKINEVFPLRSVSIHTQWVRPKDKGVSIVRIESSELGSLGYGWRDRDEMVSSKIEGIFSRPQRSFVVYNTLFTQIKEFIPEFEPNTLVLTYQQKAIKRPQTALVAFLSIKHNVLDIRYCIPLAENIGIEGTNADAYLRSLFLDSP
jgi:hypothetical protein